MTRLALWLAAALALLGCEIVGGIDDKTIQAGGSGGASGASTTATTAAGENCGNRKDDDGDKFIDCSDPGCAGSPLCQPGSRPFGSPCSANDQCAANNGMPYCDLSFGNQGYCTEFCQVGGDDCVPAGICSHSSDLPGMQGTCLKTCIPAHGDADCPTGNCCTAFGPTDNVCFPCGG